MMSFTSYSSNIILFCASPSIIIGDRGSIDVKIEEPQAMMSYDGIPRLGTGTGFN